MANDAKNVTTGKPMTTGAVFRAPLSTALPADVNTKLEDAFKCLGYVSDDGISNSSAPDTDTVKAWGGDPVLYTNNGREDTFQLTLIEATNSEVLKTIYNDSNVSGDLTSGITVRVNSDDAEEAVYVIDLILKGGLRKRIVIPDAKLTDLGEITYNDSDPVGYEATLSALPYSGFDGDTHREYIAKPTASTNG